jgi:hypothetical protein
MDTVTRKPGSGERLAPLSLRETGGGEGAAPKPQTTDHTDDTDLSP